MIRIWLICIIASFIIIKNCIGPIEPRVRDTFPLVAKSCSFHAWNMDDEKSYQKALSSHLIISESELLKEDFDVYIENTEKGERSEELSQKREM